MQSFDRTSFTVAGCACFLSVPKDPLPGKPWVWRASFPDFHAEIDAELVRGGWHIGYMETGEMLGCDAALDLWDAFYAEVTGRYGLSKKPVLEAVSRGGLYAYRWAARHPERVAAIYADTPVMDLKSWPGGKGKGPGSADIWKIALMRYGFASEAEALAYKGNPLDILPVIARAKIPLRHCISLDDQVVPAEENTLEAARRLKKLRRSMELVTLEHGTKESQGHHFFPVPEAFATGEFIRRYGWTPPGGREFFTLRDGLGRVAAKLTQGGECRVAFVGGSITAADGWRTELERWLGLHFPKAKFTFVRAGIPSLGSVPNSFRFAETVLGAIPPDLLFIEAAVNDPTNFTEPARMVRGVEGMVRQARLAKPDMGIVLMHFAMPEHLASWRAGKRPEVVTQHEKVAARYGLPSLDLTQEVAKRIAAGELSWEKDFVDLHPSRFGHQLYAASIVRMLDAALEKPIRSRSLPAMIDTGSYATAKRLSPSTAGSLNGFLLKSSWRPTDGKETRAGFVDVPALIGETPGASFSLDFEGNAIGLMITSGPDAGQLAFSIDGGSERILDAFTPWSSYLHLPWALMLADGLKPGRHKLTLKLLPTKNSKSTGTALRVLNFLVN